MQNRKYNLTKLFKTGIFFLGISLLLWNCEQEDSIEESSIKNELSQVFEDKFNTEDFQKTLRYQYTVDWSNPKKEYSEQLNSNFYEFPINYSTLFNPDEFHKQKQKRIL